MSSIAYVTDEEMLEYHRLCRNRTILFWRLSSRKKFSDFRKGDLLFFYSRPHHGRKKGLVGYAHYDSTKRLSLKQMWKQYGEATGYGTEERLEDAIHKAAKGEIPKQMRCLYLTDVVFFIAPIYPEDVGLTFPNNLESYTYLDRSDPRVTVKILEAASRRGIDLWSADPSVSPDEIFRNDVVRHQIAVMRNRIGKEGGSEKERRLSERLAASRAEEKNWEMVRGSVTDCLYMDRNKIRIALPLVYQANDHDIRVRELLGKITMYKLLSARLHFERSLSFEVLYEKEDEEVEKLIKDINNA